MIFHSILLISTDHLRNILDPVERLSTWMCPDILIPMLSAIGLCLSFFFFIQVNYFLTNKLFLLMIVDVLQ